MDDAGNRHGITGRAWAAADGRARGVGRTHGADQALGGDEACRREERAICKLTHLTRSDSWGRPACRAPREWGGTPRRACMAEPTLEISAEGPARPLRSSVSAPIARVRLIRDWPALNGRPEVAFSEM